jgi:hypothetical protein
VFATQYLAELAHMLDTTNPEIRQTSDMPVRRGEMLSLVMAQLGVALSIWDEVGLVAGRGGPQMRRAALEELGNAALQLAQLAEERRTFDGMPALERARWANNRLIALDGVNPDDPAEVDRKAPFARRTMRWILAWRAVTPPQVEAAAVGRNLYLQFRTGALADVGLSAERGNDLHIRPLEERLKGLIAEAEALRQRAPAGRPRAVAFAALYGLLQAHIELLSFSDRLAEARALHEQVERRRLAEPSGRGP